MRIETLTCPACGALLTVHETTDQDLVALQPELGPMFEQQAGVAGDRGPGPGPQGKLPDNVLPFPEGRHE